MLGVGGLLLVLRAVAHVLAGEAGGDHQHLAQALPVARGQQHAADARVERQAGQLPTRLGQLVGLVHRTKLGQQLITVGNRLAGWRLEEGEVLDRAELEALHAQDHAGQRRTQDLRVGEARTLREVGLVVEAHADAVADAAAAAGALVGRSLTDGLDLQLLDLVAVAVALDPRGAGVHHIADARHGQRGLGDVGGQHDARRAVGLEDAVLLGLAESGEKRQHFDAPARACGARVAGQVVGAQGLGPHAALALARQEDQAVAGSAAPQLVHRVAHRVGHAVVALLLEGPPALFDGKEAA